jgi:tRNA A-37 threonylcarbamoyl transferase component Bud32
VAQQTIVGNSQGMFSDSIVWGAIPEGFQKLTDLQGNRLVVRADRQREILVSTCLEIERRGYSTGVFGRGDMRSMKLADGTTALFRCYRHGGAFRSLTGKWFISWPPRPFRELSITEELRRRGFPTVEVLAACVEKIRGPIYRGWLVTRQVEGARDLWHGLQSGFCQSAGIEATLKAVAAAIYRMHREGVYHRDLNLKNILVRSTAAGVESHVIDFDRAVLVLGQLPAPLARKNLDRLLRSIRKLDPQRQYFSAAAWDGFLEYYNAAAA